MPPNYHPPVTPVQLPHNRSARLLLPLILSIILFLAALGFGIWAYMGRQDYKNNSDKKSAAAVAAAEKVLDAKKEADFAEREKQPLKSYQGSSSLGSVLVKYPKTWSAYVTESAKGSSPLNGYFHPDVVPGTDTDTAYALRLQVSNTSYDQVLKGYDSDTKSGSVSVSPITAVNVSGVTGARITGEIARGKTGVTVLFPVRDKTLIITTESQQFVGDLDSIILANLKFVP
jgi:hypothetical protein